MQAGWLRARPLRGRISVATLTTGAIFAIDALASWWVVSNLSLGERRELVPGLLVLTHIRNTGTAYGLLAGQRWLLVGVTALVVALVPFLVRALARPAPWPWTASVLTGLLVGGALGNLVERAVLGFVIDFLQVPPIALFQIFNLSDVSISLAVVFLLGVALFGKEHDAVIAPKVPRS